MVETVYCIDTSSLIELNQRYPIEIFPSLWNEVEKLINSGHLIAPIEVFKEIKYDDRLVQWVKKYKKMFKSLDFEQLERVKEIENRFPSLVDYSKETPVADPFLIALAITENTRYQETLFPRTYIIVTEETPSGGKGKSKIPDVCHHYGIECINLVDLFRKEGWKF